MIVQGYMEAWYHGERKEKKSLEMKCRSFVEGSVVGAWRVECKRWMVIGACVIGARCGMGGPLACRRRHAGGRGYISLKRWLSFGSLTGE